jgi:hypothetical protein
MMWAVKAAERMDGFQVEVLMAPRRHRRKAKAEYCGHNALNAARARTDPLNRRVHRRRPSQPPNKT